MNYFGNNYIESKIFSLKKIPNFNNDEIGLVSGCFDLVHIGHSRYLIEVRKKCGFLIVAVDSDDMIKKAKGEDRPVITEKERAEMVASFGFVDAVYIKKEQFSENDCLQISLLKPKKVFFVEEENGLNKGMAEKIIEKFGENIEVIFLPKQVPLTSTSKIIEKIIDFHEGN